MGQVQRNMTTMNAEMLTMIASTKIKDPGVSAQATERQNDRNDKNKRVAAHVREAGLQFIGHFSMAVVRLTAKPKKHFPRLPTTCFSATC
jgi:hypothetical protein